MEMNGYEEDTKKYRSGIYQVRKFGATKHNTSICTAKCIRRHRNDGSYDANEPNIDPEVQGGLYKTF
jgi:hypothetical protein